MLKALLIVNIVYRFYFCVFPIENIVINDSININNIRKALIVKWAHNL